MRCRATRVKLRTAAARLRATLRGRRRRPRAPRAALTTRRRQHSSWWKTPMSTGGWSSNSVSRPKRIARAKAQSRLLRGDWQPALLLKANHTLRVPGPWLEVRLIFPHLPAAPTASHSNTHPQCRLRSDVIGRRVRSPLSSSQIPAPAYGDKKVEEDTLGLAARTCLHDRGEYCRAPDAWESQELCP